MRLICTMMFICLALGVKAQIYTETFNNQSFGVIGPCDTLPSTCDVPQIPAATGWTISGDASGLEDLNDWFYTVSDKLEARDLAGELCFESPLVDISSIDSVGFSVVVSEVGDHESSDYVDVFAVIDGEPLLVAGWNGGDSTHTLTGNYPGPEDWGVDTVHMVGITGVELQLKICIYNNSSSEKIRLDDIEVFEQLPSTAPGVIINELDCDQTGVDTAEFIELGGPPGQGLDGFVVVMFNGGTDASYEAVELDGLVLDGDGLLVICFGPNEMTYCDINVSSSLQNGADGVGLYYNRDISEFPDGTPVSGLGLVDGLRYGTGEAIDTGLAVLDTDMDCAGDDCYIDEDADGNSGIVSIQRGSWYLGSPTPGQQNSDPLPVRYIYIRAEQAASGNEVRWATASEFHLQQFHVQHSRDGHSFETVDSVVAHHASMRMTEYTVLHRMIGAGSHYYRIAAVGEDGSLELSSIAAAYTHENQDDLSIAVKGRSVIVHTEGHLLDGLEVYDMNGRVIRIASISAGNVHTVDLPDIPAGIYIVKAIVGTRLITRKIYLM